MTRIWKVTAACVAALVFFGIVWAQQPASAAAGSAQQAGGRGKGTQSPPPPPPIDPKPEELARIREKTEQIEKLAGELNHADPVLLNDVEVYAKAGRMLLEFPE